MLNVLLKILKYIAYGLLCFLVFSALYIIAAFILSRIPVNKKHKNTQEIAIYLLSNGVHTDIVVPVKTEEIDWNKIVKFENTQSKDTSAQLVAFGWGDKGFYLETPEWSDLKFSVAFKATFGLGTSALHTTFYHHLNESPKCKKLIISKLQYSNLIEFILKRFEKDSEGMAINIKTNANYGVTDAFYESNGRYNLFYTCNSWTNDALKACEQKACLWTPFENGIFYLYKEKK